MSRATSTLVVLLSLAIAGCDRSAPVFKAPKRSKQTTTANQPAAIPNSKANPAVTNAPQSDRASDEHDLPFETRFITDDCFAALIVHPHRAFSAPALAGLPLERVLRGPIERLQLPLDQVEQAIFLLAPLAEGDLPDSPFAVLTVVRFHAAVQPEQLGRRIYREFETTVRDGHTWLRQNAPPHMTACFTDDRTMLVSTAPRVERMLAAANSASPLTEHLRSAGARYDLFAMLMVDPIRPSLGPLRQHLQPQLPSFILPLFDIAQQSRTIAIRADLRGNSLLAITAEPVDDAARAKVEEGLRGIDQAIRFAFSAFQAQTARQPRDQPTQALMDLGGELVREMKIARADNQITLTIPRPASFDNLGQHLAAVVEAAEAARQRARAQQTIPPPHPPN
jgi:hypothetical protein